MIAAEVAAATDAAVKYAAGWLHRDWGGSPPLLVKPLAAGVGEEPRLSGATQFKPQGMNAAWVQNGKFVKSAGREGAAVEAAASRMFDRLGVPHHPVEHHLHDDGNHYTVSDFAADWQPIYHTSPSHPKLDLSQAADTLLAEWVLGVKDRHGGNYVHDPKKGVISIDHGQSLLPHFDWGGESPEASALLQLASEQGLGRQLLAQPASGALKRRIGEQADGLVSDLRRVKGHTADKHLRDAEAALRRRIAVVQKHGERPLTLRHLADYHAAETGR